MYNSDEAVMKQWQMSIDRGLNFFKIIVEIMCEVWLSFTIHSPRKTFIRFLLLMFLVFVL